jgi:F0F1-type ATP synthase assembly protein I
MSSQKSLGDRVGCLLGWIILGCGATGLLIIFVLLGFMSCVESYQ